MTFDIYKTLISKLNQEDRDLYYYLWLKNETPASTKYLIKVIPATFLTLIILMIGLENREIELQTSLKISVIIVVSLLILIKPVRDYLSREYTHAWYKFLSEKGINLTDRENVDLEVQINAYLESYIE